MNAFRTHLEKNDIKQSEFANALNVGQGTVSKLASDALRPSLTLAIAIEKATGGAVPVESWVVETKATP